MVRMSVFKYISSIAPRDEVREMLIASADYNVMTCDQDTLQQPNRKRRGSLNGLSLEEKIQRKKLKNREAAQNSRDKKKAYVTNLENAITVLQTENTKLSDKVLKLLEENMNLKKKNERLEQEIIEVKAAKPKISKSEQESLDISVAEEEKRSAVPTPQQKECLSSAVLSQMILIHFLISTVWTGSMTLVKHLTLMNYQSLQIHFQKKLWNWRQKQKLLEWWGPRQKSWNPIGMMTLPLMSL